MRSAPDISTAEGSLRTFVFNGWAATDEIWTATTFNRDWTFSYVEQLSSLPEKVAGDFSDILLVGFSMGGSNALKFLVDHADKVRGAVFVSASVRMMEERSDPTGSNPRGEILWRGMGERRLAALKLGTESVYGNDPSPLFSKENLSRGLDFLRTTDLRESLEKFSQRPCAADIPVAIVSSERDGIVSRDNALFLKRIFPRAFVEIVPGNEHSLPVTVPGVIDEAVEKVKKLYLKQRSAE